MDTFTKGGIAWGHDDGRGVTYDGAKKPDASRFLGAKSGKRQLLSAQGSVLLGEGSRRWRGPYGLGRQDVE